MTVVGSWYDANQLRWVFTPKVLIKLEAVADAMISMSLPFSNNVVVQRQDPDLKANPDYIEPNMVSKYFVGRISRDRSSGGLRQISRLRPLFRWKRSG